MRGRSSTRRAPAARSRWWRARTGRPPAWGTHSRRSWSRSTRASSRGRASRTRSSRSASSLSLAGSRTSSRYSRSSTSLRPVGAVPRPSVARRRVSARSSPSTRWWPSSRSTSASQHARRVAHSTQRVEDTASTHQAPRGSSTWGFFLFTNSRPYLKPSEDGAAFLPLNPSCRAVRAGHWHTPPPAR